MEGFELTNVEEWRKLHPKTFHLPEKRVRTQMRAYDFVKVLFRSVAFGPSERIWVQIIEARDGRYRGTLANEPEHLPVKEGYEIEFGPEHIAECRIQLALSRPVPSVKRAGYTHPAGRHVTLTGGNGGAIMVQIWVPDPQGEWEEKLMIPYDAFKVPLGPDSLTVH